MSQQSLPQRPYRGLVLDTCALAVSKLSCTDFIFVEPGVKINGQYYRDVLLMQLLPAICSIAGDVFLFQQDNAPAHCACDTVELLHREKPQFISPDVWPANCPDFNPVDYRMWGMLHRRMYRVPICDTDELRIRLVATWAEIQHSEMDGAVDQWQKRLEACIRAEGGHFEHLL